MAINLVVAVLVSLITPCPADQAVAVGHALRAENVATPDPAPPATVQT